MKLSKALLIPLFTLFYITIMPCSSYGQIHYEFPGDQGGYVDVRQVGYTLDIHGTVIDQNVPDWKSLLSFSPSDCIRIEVIHEWDCHNPWHNGHRSIMFGKTLQITFDPDCKDDVCFSIKSHPEAGHICFKNPYSRNSQFSVDADIQDHCGIPLREREMSQPNHIDIDEPIKLYAKIKSGDPQAEFPPDIDVNINSCGVSSSRNIVMTHQESGWAEYLSNDYTASELANQSASQGFLTLAVNYGRSARYAAYADEVCFTVSGINFYDSISIINQYGNNAACYPYNGWVNFAPRVQVGDEIADWPTDCISISAEMSGEVHGQFIRNYSAQCFIEADSFIPEPSQVWQINHDILEEDAYINWTISVNNGPTREVAPYQTNMTIFHGFDSTPIRSEPEDATTNINEYIDLLAWTYPKLSPSLGVFCNWHVDNAPHGQGRFLQNPTTNDYYYNRFKANYPGDYTIRCTVTHQLTNSSADFQNKIIHVRPPKIDIVLPPDNWKVRYDYSMNGTAQIYYGASATPSNLSDDIHWKVSSIPGVNISSSPNPPVGDEGYFTYSYLPNQNSSFGPKTITASLPDFDVTISKDFKLFYYYNEEVNNNPGHSLPNWFYYWKQGAVPGFFDPSVKYKSWMWNLVGQFRWFDNQEIWIGYLACDAGRKYLIPGIDYPFDIKSGIDYSQEIYDHESFHRWIYLQWAPPSGQWYLQYCHGQIHPCLRIEFPTHEQRKWPGVDDDGDMLPNDWERSTTLFQGIPIHLSSDTCDTYNLFIFDNIQEAKDFGDQELLCIINARLSRGNSTLDWSAGKYSKNWP